MSDTYEGWAVLELMGHRRLAGWIREVEAFGSVLLRIDVPAVAANGSGFETTQDGIRYAATQMYGGQAIYCITPTDEKVVLAVCRQNQPAPVHHWELPAPRREEQTASTGRHEVHDDDDEWDDDGDHSPPF